jgi:uncharacterized membrane protein YfcA
MMAAGARMLIVAALVGAATGVISGLMGLGGAIVLIPALVYLFGMSQHEAQGTSLATLLLPIGIFAFLQYYRAGHVNLRIAAAIALGFAIGGYFGGRWAQLVPDVILKKTFAVVLVLAAIRMWISSR